MFFQQGVVVRQRGVRQAPPVYPPTENEGSAVLLGREAGPA